MESGHNGEVAHIFLALEQLLDALFNARRNFLQSFPIGGFLSHDFHSPFYGRNFSGVFCNPLVLFLGAAVEKGIQQIAHVIFFLNGFQKSRVRDLIRCFGRMVDFPFLEQMIVAHQDAPTMLPCVLTLLRLGFLPDIAPPGRGLAVIDQAKILGQLFSGLPGGQVIEPGGEVDHVAGGSAAEAVEVVLVQFQAGVPVIVEGAIGHAAALYLDAVHFRRFSGGDGFFHNLKNILCHAHSTPAFLTGRPCGARRCTAPGPTHSVWGR